jgi:hypothetical protein
MKFNKYNLYLALFISVFCVVIISHVISQLDKIVQMGILELVIFSFGTIAGSMIYASSLIIILKLFFIAYTSIKDRLY